MPDCEYCEEDFSSERKKLEHELDEHEGKMSGHDRSDKKSELNKLEQQDQTNKHQKKKKLQYGAVAVLFVGLVAGGGFFAYQNPEAVGMTGLASESASGSVGEPVHWHADYRITVCGESKILQGGPVEAHTHGEQRFHLEGVRKNKDQTQLEWIVDSLGGKMEENSIMGKDSCNGEPANLTVKANGEKLEDPLNYVVRDGDYIEISYE